MKLFRYSTVLLLSATAFLQMAFAGQPTFADLAVVVAKGHFKDYVDRGASLEECAAFLNSKGVCFSLFDLMDPNAVVSQEDFARALGQSTLLFMGEAEVVNGSVKKPLEIKTWVDYCLLNDVDLHTLWNGFLQRIEQGSLPEVRRFFGDSYTTGEKK